jgi:hypothetical protein
VTVVVLIADAPVEGVACSDIVAETDLSPADGVELYQALLKDVFETLAESTVDVLVNYPAPDDLPPDVEPEMAPEVALKGLAGAVVDPDRLEDFRFEVQVGSSFSAKAGNAITHLLRDEEQHSAAVLRPCVPRLVRSVVDEAAIKLRRNDVVLGPARDGRVYFAGFTELIDFTDVFETNAQETIAGRAGEKGLTVDFARERAMLESARDLRSVVMRLRAEMLAGNPVPEHLWTFVEDRGLSVENGELVIESAGTTPDAGT